MDRNPPAKKGPFKELPLSEYRDSTLLNMYEGSRLSWSLKTMHLVKWPRTDLVRARPVDLVMFDTVGAQVVQVTADSGSVDEAISFLAASGHVHAHSAKGVDILTDSLRWNKTLNQINTEARVKVVSEDGDTLTGRGFISDAKLDNWQILADVKGVFQKVEERFQEADKDSSRADSSSQGGADTVGLTRATDSAGSSSSSEQPSTPTRDLPAVPNPSSPPAPADGKAGE